MKRTNLTQAEERELAKRLRYINPENIANDFEGYRERAAIVAVFKWMSLNFVCAHRLKRPCHYRTNMRRTDSFAVPPDAYVLDRDRWEQAEKVLGIK